MPQPQSVAWDRRKPRKSGVYQHVPTASNVEQRDMRAAEARRAQRPSTSSTSRRSSSSSASGVPTVHDRGPEDLREGLHAWLSAGRSSSSRSASQASAARLSHPEQPQQRQHDPDRDLYYDRDGKLYDFANPPPMEVYARRAQRALAPHVARGTDAARQALRPHIQRAQEALRPRARSLWNYRPAVFRSRSNDPEEAPLMRKPSHSSFLSQDTGYTGGLTTMPHHKPEKM